ncbi:hypothetical protein [Schlesneria paludicola]|uniref:hypothetical protein n=1 Tax=Schlesneria paludicola TaxID=360056 RepID=UPI000299FD12|nr:hypothetical protein [Schlesneria paludicola]
MSAATVYPNGDGTKTGFSDQAGGTTNLYATVSEGTGSPNDSNYITNTDSGGKPLFFLLGDMPGDFVAATSVSISIRVRRDNSKSNSCAWIACQLVQADEATALTASATVTDTTTTTTFTFTPNVTGATGKSAWDGARLMLTMRDGGLVGGLVYLYAAQVTVTYSTASASAKLLRRRRMMLEA